MHAVVLVTAGADIHLARAAAARPSPAGVRRRVRALPNNVIAAVGYFNRLEVFDSTAGFDCVFVADWLDDQLYLWTGDGAPHCLPLAAALCGLARGCLLRPRADLPAARPGVPGRVRAPLGGRLQVEVPSHVAPCAPVHVPLAASAPSSCITIASTVWPFVWH